LVSLLSGGGAHQLPLNLFNLITEEAKTTKIHTCISLVELLPALEPLGLKGN
jgi:hypothetical protein